MRELTDDQELLRQTTERFIAASFPLTAVRARADRAGAVESTYWSQAAELGWCAFLVPEAHGGGTVSDSGVADAAVVADEHGRGLQPGPLVPVNVVADAIARYGTPEQQAAVLPELASGSATAAWAVASVAGDWSGPAGVAAVATGSGLRLDGAKGLVQDADVARWLLVTAASEAGPVQVLVDRSAPGVSVTVMEGLDLTRRFCTVTLEGVEVAPGAMVGSAEHTAEALRRQFEVALALSLSESVGAMDRLFTTTVEYAKDRTAFGRPIGSFQAIKHLLADTSLLLEASKGTVSGVIGAVAADGDDAAEIASIGKAYISEAAVALAHNCWQTFGGIAYTWEHDFHLFMRRLTTDAALYGDASWHRERICQIHGL